MRNQEQSPGNAGIFLVLSFEQLDNDSDRYYEKIQEMNSFMVIESCELTDF